MTTDIPIHPKTSLGSDFFRSLPYEESREDLDCGHSLIYIIQAIEDGPLLCGLCFFRAGYESELPSRFHLFKTLAENGNPEMSPKFVVHLNLIMGLAAPKLNQSLKEFRDQRNSLARRQYTRRPKGLPSQTYISVESYSKPARSLFPVASALWVLMGYQPPLGIVLVRAVGGRTEAEIARELDVSLVNIHNRMAKAIRTALRFLPDDEVDRTTNHHSSGGDVGADQESASSS